MAIPMFSPSLFAAIPSLQWAGIAVFFSRHDVLVFLVAAAAICCAVAVARPRQIIRMYTEEEFAELGFTMIGCKKRGATKSKSRRFKAHFGASPAIAAQLWRELSSSDWLRYAGYRPKAEHLLFALVFLRCYCSEELNATLCKTNVRKFRRWSWFYAEGIANLDKRFIRWENRFIGDTGERALVTIDGVDFMIVEPRPLNPKWFSKKFKNAAVRYELGVCIFTGHIVHYVGPFHAGGWNDLNIFRYKMKGMLSYGEKVVADKGYRGEPKVITQDRAKDDSHLDLMNRARARHETVNARIKQWKCLANRFHHHNSKHHICFRAVLTIEQMKMNENPHWQCENMGDRIV